MITRFLSYDLIIEDENDDGKSELNITIPKEDYNLIRKAGKVEMLLKLTGNDQDREEEDNE